MSSTLSRSTQVYNWVPTNLLDYVLRKIKVQQFILRDILFDGYKITFHKLKTQFSLHGQQWNVTAHGYLANHVSRVRKQPFYAPHPNPVPKQITAYGNNLYPLS